MTDVISGFGLRIFANTPINAPRNTQCPLNWSDVNQIMITFPPGCSNTVGVQVQYAGNVVYPIGLTPWFIMDDFTLEIPVSNQQNGGQWSIWGYNLGPYDHFIMAYFSWDYLATDQQAQRSPLVSL